MGIGNADYIVEAERTGGGFAVFCSCGNETDGGQLCPDCERELYRQNDEEDNCVRRPDDE